MSDGLNAGIKAFLFSRIFWN